MSMIKIKGLVIVLLSLFLGSTITYSQNNNNNVLNFLYGEWYLQSANYHYTDNEFFEYNLASNKKNKENFNEIDYQVLVDPIFIKFDRTNLDKVIISNIRHNIQTLLFEIDKENILYIGQELYYQIHIKSKNAIELKYQDENVILNLEYKRKE